MSGDETDGQTNGQTAVSREARITELEENRKGEEEDEGCRRLAGELHTHTHTRTHALTEPADLN